MKKITIVVFCIALASNSPSFSNEFDDAFSELEQAVHQQYSAEGKQKEQSEFEQWKTQQEKEYEAYKQAYFEALNKYKSSILEHWAQAEVTNKKNWVEYSDNLKTKRVVDFEKNEIRISLLDIDASDKEIETLVADNLQRMLKQTPNSARKRDPVLKAVGSTKESSDEQSRTLLLSELISNKEQNIDNIAKSLSRQAVIRKPTKKPQGVQKEPIVVTIRLPKNSMGRRAAKYQPLVKKNAAKNRLDEALVNAIIHTESAFNPMARSNIPAYGLMQIVPESAGRDVSVRLYGKDQIFSADYLYNASNNIQAGSTYINILYYSYLKGVNDPLSRMYCVIAAYNTGAGNVARAFSNGRNLRKALPTINSMTPEQVHDRLIKNLPYHETRDYLKRVLKRQKLYAST